MATIEELARDIGPDVSALVADMKASGQLQTFSDSIQKESKMCASLLCFTRAGPTVRAPGTTQLCSPAGLRT